MAKLARFDTVILWESFIGCDSKQLSHSITVPNSFDNIWMGLLSTITMMHPPACFTTFPRPVVELTDEQIFWAGLKHFLCDVLSGFTIVHGEKYVFLSLFTKALQTDQRTNEPTDQRTNGPMDQRTNGPTDRWTDKASHRVASPGLKKKSVT